MDTQTLNKELAPIKTRVSKAVAVATALEIKTANDLTKATNTLNEIKIIGEMIKSKKEGMTKPANEILKNARAFFNPVEKEYLKAEKIVKDKMLFYYQAEKAKAAKQEKKIVEKVEKGQMNFDKAADKIEAITPQKTVEAKAGTVQFRTIRDIEIVDETKLPREYLVPDMVKIRKVVLAGIEIPDVKLVEKQVVAGFTNKV